MTVTSGRKLTISPGVQVSTSSTFYDVFVSGTIDANGVDFTGTRNQFIVRDGGRFDSTQSNLAGQLIEFQQGSNGTWTYNEINLPLQIHSGSTTSVFDNFFNSGTAIAVGEKTQEIDLTSNYWDSTDSSIIEDRILHQNDDANRPLVRYTPFLTSIPQPSQTSFSIVATNADRNEGTIGSTQFQFTVRREGDLGEEASVTYTVVGSGPHPAQVSDFASGALGGSLVFGVGQSSRLLTVSVNGDLIVEPNEGFSVTLVNPSPNAIITNGTAAGVIRNDDTAIANMVVTGNGQVITNGSEVLGSGLGTLFDNKGVGETGSTQSFVVSNPGDAPLQITQLRYPDGFSVVDPLATTIAPGDSDTLSLQLKTHAVGVQTGFVLIETNVPTVPGFAFLIAGKIEGVIGENEVEPNSRVEWANDLGRISTERSVNGLLTWPSEPTPVINKDFFEFQTDSVGDLRYEITASARPVDLTLRFVNSTGTFEHEYVLPANSSLITQSAIIEDLPAGEYYVVVSSSTLTGSQSDVWYQLSLSVDGEETAILPDRFEDPAGASSAIVPVSASGTFTAVTLHDANQVGTTEDRDYFEISISAATDTSHFVEAIFSHAQSDVDLNLFETNPLTDPRANRIRFSASVNDKESIPLGGLATGTYYLEVYSYDGRSTMYDLNVTLPNSAAEVVVTGNGQNIVDGDSTPSVSDHTVLGTQSVGGVAPHRTFTVSNNGTATLTTSGLDVTTGFVIVEGLESSIEPGQSDTFTVSFNTATVGTIAGQVRFSSNDVDESIFEFDVSATVTEVLDLPTLIVGLHRLLPNTPNQRIEIFVTGTAEVTGFNLRAQLGDGIDGSAEPDFNGVELNGGIWTSYPTTVSDNGLVGADQMLQSSVSFNNQGDRVIANGLIATLIVDTTGFSSGQFPLLLSGTQIGQDSDFTGQQIASLPVAITNGSIEIVPTAVVDRRFLYNNSFFDGFDVAVDTSDDGAIPNDKVALLPGQKATFANYTSYSRGINGIVLDVLALRNPAALTASDFRFRVGNSQDPSQWIDAPAPSSIDIRPDGGDEGVSRITLLWPDRMISQQWLQVTVLPTPATGLPAPDVSYFGNVIGESGNASSNTFVDASDFGGARDFPHNFIDRALIEDAYDYNRDSFVDGSDLGIARDFANNFLSSLVLLDLRSAASGEPITSLTSPANGEASEANATTIDVGAHSLLPNTPNQRIEIMVSGEAKATGINIRAQLGDGSGPLVEPIFTDADFTNTIWSSSVNTTSGGIVQGFPMFFQGSVAFNNRGDEVTANGRLFTFVIDTTGINAGTFELKIFNTQIGADTELNGFEAATIDAQLVNGSITIADEVTLPTVSIAISPVSVNEDGDGELVYTFTRTGNASEALNLTYTVGGNAVAGTDFGALPGTLTIGAGTMSATVSVNPTDNETIEGDRTLSLTLEDGDNYELGTAVLATGTILDNDVLPTVSVSVSPASINEDGAGQLVYKFTRSGNASEALNVTYTVGGSAVAGTDFDALPGTLTIGAGVMSATVSVNPNDNNTVDGDRMVSLSLIDGDNYDIGITGLASATIHDNDLMTSPLTARSIIGSHVIPGDGAATVILFRTLRDTVVEIAGVDSTNIDERYFIVDDSFSQMGRYENGGFSALLSADRIYALVAKPGTVSHSIMVKSSAGEDALSGLVDRNPLQPTDVTGDGTTTAIDALRVINELNSMDRSGEPVALANPYGFTDVNGDGHVTALDALLVVNHLNRVSQSADSEPPVQSSRLDSVPQPILINTIRVQDNEIAAKRLSEIPDFWQHPTLPMLLHDTPASARTVATANRLGFKDNEIAIDELLTSQLWLQEDDVDHLFTALGK
jgi:hypothetical protein